MKFIIVISTGFNNRTSPYDYFNPGKGLDYVEAIRELAGMPDCPLEYIEVNDTCTVLTGASECKLGTKKEDDIVLIDRFDVSQESNVYVPAGFLGQFVRMTVEIRRQNPDQASCDAQREWMDKNPSPDSDDIFYRTRNYFWKRARNNAGQRGEEICKSTPKDERLITKLSNGWEVDKKAIYKAWKEAGFPVYWGMTEETFFKQKEERRKILIQIKAEEEKKKEEELREKRAREKSTILHLAEDCKAIGTRLVKIMASDGRH